MIDKYIYILIYMVISFIPHVIIILMNFILNKMKYVIDIEYKIIRLFIPLYFVIPIIMCLFIDLPFKNLSIQIYYGICVILITLIDENEYYLLLGLSISAFISEYWEIPFFISSYINNGFFDGTNIYNILIRMSVIFFVLYYMKKLNINYKMFIILIIVYAILYTIFIFNVPHDTLIYSGWFFRFITFIYVYLFLIYSKVLKGENIGVNRNV